RLGALALEGLGPDGVVVELDEGAVAERVGREIVILDALGDETAADRARALVAARGQPLAVGAHLLAGVHRRQRRGDPARLESVAGVGARAHLLQPEVL